MSSGKKTSKRAKRRNVSQQSTLDKLLEERGSVAQFARDLSKSSGQEISWARVNGWKIRGAVSKSMVLHVHRLTGVPLSKLLP